ncbi:MAG: hemolysin family protein [Clostridiaceae bacterium]
MEQSGSIIPYIILLVLLIIVNGLFSASEMAIVSANRNKIQAMAEDGDTRAAVLMGLLSKPSNFLATIQVGITFAGFLTAGSASTVFGDMLVPVLKNVGIPVSYGRTIAQILITVVISYFSLVFGELLPKRVALQNPEKIALTAAKPINFFSKLTRPFVLLLSGSTTLFGKMAGIHSETLEEEISIEEIRSMIEVGKEKGVINQTERDMLDGIFEFDNKLAREVMTPRPDIIMADISEEPEEILKLITNSRFSRIPIYEGEQDNIIGLIVLKDIYRELLNKGKVTDIRKLMREVLFVPETKHIDMLFKQMQSTNNHFAVLIDEYGGLAGIVTIEDLLEEIVGNIFDEHDISFKEINKIDDNVYIIDALVTVDQVNDDLNLELDTENADTIGGYFIEKIGRVPMKGDKVEDVEIDMEVLRLRGKRIKDLRVIKKDVKATEASEYDI